MSPLEIRPGIRRLFQLAVRRRARVEAELDDEIQLHIALRTQQLVAEGKDPESARAEAEKRFGLQAGARRSLRRSAVSRECHFNRVERLDALRQDLRYAIRGLHRNPGFTAVAILTLALGIGANTAIFSVVDAVLLRSLPVRHPEQLVQVTMGDDGGVDEMTNPVWETLRDRQDAFSGMFAWSDRRFDLADGGETRPAEGMWVSGGFFDVLGVPAAVGRTLRASDDHRGCAPVAVLSHGFWERSYGGDASAVGKTIALDGHPFEIVGVADESFSGIEVGRATQIYAPLCAIAIVDGGAGGLDDRSTWFLRIMGRQRAGLTTEQMRGRLAAMSPAVFAAAAPLDIGASQLREFVQNRFSVSPAATGFSDMRLKYRTALLVLSAVVGLVLLIACANVANLLLARAVSRRREIAIRLAVGARRGRLVRQLFTESALLALVGACVGLLFARWASGALLSLLSLRDAVVWLDLSIDARVLAFTICVAMATALLFGLVPAWRATRVDVHAAMTTSEQAGDDHGRFTTVKSLVVGQIALSLMLLLGAGLLLTTFRTLATMDPGFERDGVLLVSADLRAARYTGQQMPDVMRQLLDRLRSTPGVRGASASTITPISGAGWNGDVIVDGFVPTGRRDAMSFFNAVSDGYFATLGTRLLAGRDFDVHDVAGAPGVAVINEAFARKFFRGSNPLGRRIGLRAGSPEHSVTVIGVVRDTKYASLREQTRELVYLPMAQEPGFSPTLNIEVRGPSAATTLVPSVTAAITELNPRVSLTFTTLSAQVNGSLARERMLATLSAFFGLLALLLAVIGLYGTMSYTLAQRRKELGVRIALGAARSRVVGLVLGEVGRLLAIGVVLGSALAYLCTRWVTPFLFGVTPIDPLTWVMATATLACAALAAGALPAWRAASADPMLAIRTD